MKRTYQSIPAQVDVIVPNISSRFSGITSTVAQVLPQQARELSIVTVGHPVPGFTPHVRWRDAIRLARGRAGGPAIFHARRNIEMIAGLALKRIFRCPLHLVFTSTAQRRHSWLTRALYWRMDTLLSTSPMAARYLERQPDAIVPHGIDQHRYRPASDRQGEWMDGGLRGTVGVGIFGRVREQKGIRDFVCAMCEVLPEFPQVTAVIVGEATPEQRSFATEMKSIIEGRGLSDRFRWMGKLPFSEIPLWFRRMSLVVCASHNEGFGLTCLEAMASGVPVVATRAGAWEMIIREGVDGWVVPPRDAAALAGALRSALSAGPEHLDSMGRAARERVLQAFTIEREAGMLSEIYRNILGARGAPR